MSEVRLTLEGLVIEGPERRLVDGVSFEVHDGEVLGLVGPSGVGKSLSVQAAMGVVDVVPGVIAGSLWYHGTPLGDVLDGVRGSGGATRLESRTRAYRGRWITLAPQAAASALNPGRTVGAHLHAVLAEGGVDDALEAVGLAVDVARRLPSELSGGMAQRVGIALALAPKPRVLVADEPEAGLDPVLRRDILALLAERARAEGCATVLVSHDHRSLGAFAHRVVEVGS